MLLWGGGGCLAVGASAKAVQSEFIILVKYVSSLIEVDVLDKI